jgi:hypothetical protein
MAAATGRPQQGAARLALEVDGSEDDGAAPLSDLMAAAGAPRGPPPRHTLLHISCGGCEWCADGAGGHSQYVHEWPQHRRWSCVWSFGASITLKAHALRPPPRLVASAPSMFMPWRGAPPHARAPLSPRDTFHAMFQHATLSGDALDYIETLLLDTPGPVPSDHRALSLYALLYQARARARARGRFSPLAGFARGAARRRTAPVGSGMRMHGVRLQHPAGSLPAQQRHLPACSLIHPRPRPSLPLPAGARLCRLHPSEAAQRPDPPGLGARAVARGSARSRPWEGRPGVSWWQQAGSTAECTFSKPNSRLQERFSTFVRRDVLL